MRRISTARALRVGIALLNVVLLVALVVVPAIHDDGSMAMDVVWLGLVLLVFTVPFLSMIALLLVDLPAEIPERRVSSMAEPKNEAAICDGVVKFLEHRTRQKLHPVARPDVTDRQNEAVELVVESADTKFAIEHTRIESFPDQIADGHAFQQLMEPLETSLRGALRPGRYRLTIDIGAASRVRRKDLDAVRGAIHDWAAQQGATLKLGPDDRQNPRDMPWHVTETPANVPFEITLQRMPPADQVAVFVARFSPPDIEKARRTRVETALEKKCRKLAAAKVKFGATSVLVLESDDIALANRHEVSQTVVNAIQARNDVPDIILLVETDRGLEWLLWVVKDRDALYPAIENPGPFPMRGVTSQFSAERSARAV